MQIIRIEHPLSGNGIFHSNDAEGNRLYNSLQHNDFIWRHDDIFPTPREDHGIRREITKNEFCAFKTIEQLQSLFYKEELDELISIGFNVLLINIDICVVGDQQILFEKENIISSEIINTLFI